MSKPSRRYSNSRHPRRSAILRSNSTFRGARSHRLCWMQADLVDIPSISFMSGLSPSRMSQTWLNDALLGAVRNKCDNNCFPPPHTRPRCGGSDGARRAVHEGPGALPRCPPGSAFTIAGMPSLRDFPRMRQVHVSCMTSRDSTPAHTTQLVPDPSRRAFRQCTRDCVQNSNVRRSLLSV